MRREESDSLVKYIKRGALTVVGLVMALVLWFNFTETIDQGHVGVVYSRSNGVQEQTLSQGLHFVNPMTRITQYPVSTETVKYKGLKLSTKDGKSINATVTFDYYNDATKTPHIYDKFKGQAPDVIEESWLRARLTDASLKVTSKYTILQVFQNLTSIHTEIQKTFKEDVKAHGFIVERVIFSPEADKETQVAIQKVVDKQQELEALKVETMKAEETAKKQLIEAEGKANAEIEEARGVEEANKIVSKSITPEILKMEEIKARQKFGWVEVTGAEGLIVDKESK